MEEKSDNGSPRFPSFEDIEVDSAVDSPGTLDSAVGLRDHGPREQQHGDD